MRGSLHVRAGVVALGTLASASLLSASTWAGSAGRVADPCAEASAAAWKALEDRGGVVPEIEADDVQAPPAWWHFPGPRRAAELLAVEARDAKAGLYSSVAPDDLEPGDVVVRVTSAGACGRMAVLAGRADGHWQIQDGGGGAAAATTDGLTRAGDDAFFVGGRTLRPEAFAYRIRVRGDNSLAHARELERDLIHLERTIGERPPSIARGGRPFVDEKVHDLLDEAWSLLADPAFDQERRELAGRALALAAALDWPGAAESAAAVLDDVLVRSPQRSGAAIARARVFLLAGQADRAARLAEAALALPGAEARARYVLGRALLAAGKTDEGVAALRKYLVVEPTDARASRLIATAGREPRFEPAPGSESALTFFATAERAGAASPTAGLRVEWPIPWRVVAKTVTPDGGLVIDLVTERVLDTAAEPTRGFASVLAQRPETAPERAALVKRAGRTLFPDAKLKTLPPLVPGSRRESFREPGEGGGGSIAGEITTLERGGVVTFVVVKAPARAFAKLKDEFAAFVKSVGAAPAR